jgi:hypothetical protein
MQPKYVNSSQCLTLFQINLWCEFIIMVTITAVCAVQIVKIFDNYITYFVRDDVNEKMMVITPCEQLRVLSDC